MRIDEVAEHYELIKHLTPDERQELARLLDSQPQEILSGFGGLAECQQREIIRARLAGHVSGWEALLESGKEELERSVKAGKAIDTSNNKPHGG